MRRPFELFVALRYLRGAEGRGGGTRFLRFVTYVAIGGVAIGVTALLMALMVVRGFSTEIEEKIVAFGSHVQVDHFVGQPLGRADTLAPRLAAFEGVERVTPVAAGFVLMRTGAEIEGVVMNGLPADAPVFLRDQIVAGDFSFDAPAGTPGVVLGRGLANLLAVDIGDPVLGMAMRDYAGAAALVRPRVVGFTVTGIYETGLADFDRSFVYTDINDARRLLGLQADEVTRFELILDRLERSRETAAAINEAIPIPVTARSIYQVQANLFAWVNLQQSIIPLVIGVIILVAAFNIIGLLLMVILEKTREIGVLRSMGTTAAGVRRLFVSLGFLVGTVGTGLGLMLALGLGLIQDRFGVIPLPQEAYYIDTAPVELYAPDFLLVSVVALILCTLAAYVPARVASRVEPVRSIRFAG